MREHKKNVIALFVICLLLVPTFIYGASIKAMEGQEPLQTVQKTAEKKVLQKITVLPRNVELTKGATEAQFKEKITVSAYFKGDKAPQVVTDYTTNFGQIKDQTGNKTVKVQYTVDGCCKQAKVCVTFCKDSGPTVPTTSPSPSPTVTPETTPSPSPSATPDTGDDGIGKSMTPYISGYPDGTFRPNQPTTREEFASMLAHIVTGNKIPTNLENVYKDVENSRYSNAAIAYLTKEGVISPDKDGNFRPADAITKSEGKAMLEALSSYIKDQDTHWPLLKNKISRAEAVVMLNKMFDVDCESVDTTKPNFSDINEDTPHYAEIICATRGKAQPRVEAK